MLFWQGVLQIEREFYVGKIGKVVNVITGGSVKESISPSDAEMDRRAQEAVKAAIHRAKACGKPMARYDKILEMPDGEKRYF